MESGTAVFVLEELGICRTTFNVSTTYIASNSIMLVIQQVRAWKLAGLASISEVAQDQMHHFILLRPPSPIERALEFLLRFVSNPATRISIAFDSFRALLPPPEYAPLPGQVEPSSASELDVLVVLDPAHVAHWIWCTPEARNVDVDLASSWVCV